MNMETEKVVEDRDTRHYAWMDTYHIPQTHGTAAFEIHDWTLVPHATGEFLEGSKFSVGAFDRWQMQIYPGGVDAVRSRRISVVIKNLGADKVRASCRLLVQTIAGVLECFAQSDNGHIFGGSASNGDSWLVDMPVTYEDTLKESCPYVWSNTMKIVADMTVCGSPSILSMDSSAVTVETESATLASDMRFLLHETTTPGMKSDVVLASGEERIPCHQCILSARSPVFREIFHAPATGMKLILHAGKLYTSDIEPHVLKDFVNFIYTDQCRLDNMSGQYVMSLFASSSKYHVNGLTALCEQWLSNSLTTESVCEVIAMAHEWENPRLTNSCLKFIGTHAAEVMRTEGFQLLDADVCRMVVEEVSSTGKGMPESEAEGGEEVKMQDIPAGAAHTRKGVAFRTAREGMSYGATKNVAIPDRTSKFCPDKESTKPPTDFGANGVTMKGNLSDYAVKGGSSDLHGINEQKKTDNLAQPERQQVDIARAANGVTSAGGT